MKKILFLVPVIFGCVNNVSDAKVNHYTHYHKASAYKATTHSSTHTYIKRKLHVQNDISIQVYAVDMIGLVSSKNMLTHYISKAVLSDIPKDSTSNDTIMQSSEENKRVVSRQILAELLYYGTLNPVIEANHMPLQPSYNLTSRDDNGHKYTIHLKSIKPSGDDNVTMTLSISDEYRVGRKSTQKTMYKTIKAPNTRTVWFITDNYISKDKSRVFAVGLTPMYF